jgi:hypothetical protein
MSIQFFPFNIALSSSLAISASYAVTTSIAGFPVTAALAEYAINYIGPTGPSGSFATRVTIL